MLGDIVRVEKCYLRGLDLSDNNLTYYYSNYKQKKPVHSL